MSKMHIVADMEINKILRAFDTKQDAIEYVGRLLKTNGDDYVHSLSIGRQTADGHIVDIVTGDELLALVQEAATTRELVGTGGGSYGGGSYGGNSHDPGDSGYGGYGAIAAKSHQ